MQKLVSLLFFVIVLPSYAQDYLISFSGTDLTSVKVENLTSGLVVNMTSGDVLHLAATTSIAETILPNSSNLSIYPNPMAENSTIQIIPPKPGNVIITVYALSGKIITKFNDYLDNNIQEYDLSGLGNGLYLVSVKGDGFQFSGKLLSTGNIKRIPSIARAGINIHIVNEKILKSDIKGSCATVDMVYNTGERLKYTANSGNNSTVMTDIPSLNKTVDFSFVECKDGSNNYYSVVQIGTQTWMAENLRATKFNDGTDIPLVTDYTDWDKLSTPGYCWYKNDADTYKIPYGALYNWFTVSTGKLCPAGWHVATNPEWATLVNTYLGGGSVAGGKLKETGTAHWKSPNTGASNETGFTALPGGNRTYGASRGIGYGGFWWTATQMQYGNCNVPSDGLQLRYCIQ